MSAPDKSYYSVENLLWFHEEVDIFSYTIDNYKRKYFAAEEFVVESSDQVKDLIANGVENIKCLRIKPTCEKDLRNRKFILEVGAFAQKHDIMILLDGTQLTHLYYQLKMTNAKVVCSEKDELLYSDTLEFNKLVRDRIPEKIISNGEQIQCAYITEELLDRMLLEKLLEEAYEVSDAHNTQDIMSELADVMEICTTLLLRSKQGPISSRDLLRNRKVRFIDEYSNISSFLIPVRDTLCHYTFRHENLCGVIKIERQKTVYRVEVDLKNGKLETPKSVSDEKDEVIICQLKNQLVKQCSMLLNVAQSKRIIEYINRILALIKEFASAMNVTMEQIEEIRKTKQDKNGGFEKGYILKQTSLKDTVIDDEREFNPNDCSEIYDVPRESSKYFDVLYDYKKNQICLVLRFSLPIAVNNWEIIFESENFKKILENTSAVKFTALKTKTGRLKLEIHKRTFFDCEQLLLFE